MVIDERQIPVRETVKGACEILGLDPLYVANEGKLLAIVASDSVAAVLHRRSRERSPGNGANENRHWRHAGRRCPVWRAAATHLLKDHCPIMSKAAGLLSRYSSRRLRSTRLSRDTRLALW